VALLTIGPIVAGAVVAMWPCVENLFSHFDDFMNFENNDRFIGLGLPQVAWAWKSTLLGVYQPISWMFLSAQSSVWGVDPHGYHAVSVVLHAANAVALYYLTLSLLGRCIPGFGSSLVDRIASAAPVEAGGPRLVRLIRLLLGSRALQGPGRRAPGRARPLGYLPAPPARGSMWLVSIGGSSPRVGREAPVLRAGDPLHAVREADPHEGRLRTDAAVIRRAAGADRARRAQRLILRLEDRPASSSTTNYPIGRARLPPSYSPTSRSSRP
jgi:hypothetical protein